MAMVKIKVAEAGPKALDWLVAICEGHRPPLLRVLRGNVALPQEDDPLWCDYLEYSTDWSQGGPIIEREGICTKSEARDHSLWSAQFAYCRQVLRWPQAELVWSYCLHRGPTTLIAAMRCYVASKLGDEVEVPEELLT